MALPDFLKEHIPADKVKEVEEGLAGITGTLQGSIEKLEATNVQLKEEKEKLKGTTDSTINSISRELATTKAKLKVYVDKGDNPDDNNSSTQDKLRITELEGQVEALTADNGKLTETQTQLKTANDEAKKVKELSSHLAKMGIKNQTHIDDLVRLHSLDASVDEETGKVIFKDGKNVVEATKFYESWKDTDRAKSYIGVGASTGSGATGGGTDTGDAKSRYETLLKQPVKTGPEQLEMMRLANELKNNK
jgi:hypothetical protein